MASIQMHGFLKSRQTDKGGIMKATVLLFNFQDKERVMKIRRALLPLKFCIRQVPKSEYLQPAGFLAGDYAYRPVVSFAPLSVAAGAEGGAEPLPGRRVAAAVCRDSDGDITAVYRRLADFIRARGLRPRSDVYSLSLVNVIDPTAARRYLK